MLLLQESNARVNMPMDSFFRRFVLNENPLNLLVEQIFGIILSIKDMVFMFKKG